jgi:C-terminal processing protease CtpA/Prc
VEIRSEGALEAERFLGKPVFILTGARTFSAAEMFASTLQQAGRAVVIGTRTRGGGNPVARIRLTPHYALLLPTTRGVVPGGKSWEGVGIVPDVAATEKDALSAARRAALAELLRREPNDMLAENWRALLAELSLAATASAAGSTDGGSK